MRESRLSANSIPVPGLREAGKGFAAMSLQTAPRAASRLQSAARRKAAASATREQEHAAASMVPDIHAMEGNAMSHKQKSQEQNRGSGARKVELERRLDANSEAQRKTEGRDPQSEASYPKDSKPVVAGISTPEERD
jgi:hypothetical protein